MATETRYLYNDEDLSRFANQVKELMINDMLARDLLTNEEATRYLEQYAVVVVKKGWLGTAIDKAIGLKDADDKKIQLIKMA
jgi:hypothetical protein